MGLKYYLATRVENWFAANEIADALNGAGWFQTYRWTGHGKNGNVEHLGDGIKREVAENEVNGVLAADVLIVLAPGGRGTHCEVGVALGSNKPIFIWAEKEKDLKSADGQITTFYYHSNVTRCICSRDEVIKNMLHWSKEYIKSTPSGLWR